jgi:hypothetical protein
VRKSAGVAAGAPVCLCETCPSHHHFHRSYQSVAIVEMVTHRDKRIFET